MLGLSTKYNVRTVPQTECLRISLSDYKDTCKIRNTYPGKERQIQDGSRVVIFSKQNPSHDPEQGIREELE